MASRARAVCRLLLGPLAVAAFAATRLAQLGVVAAAAGAYAAFVFAQFAVSWWSRRQFRRAHRRLIIQRTQRARRSDRR
jgi:hypothetical protein